MGHDDAALTPATHSGGMFLRMLGVFELATPGADGELVRIMSGQKPLALLAYLALAPGRRASRDKLVDLLWRNVDSERARRTLRQTLWTLRQRLGEEAIQNDGEELVLALALETDVARFEAALEAGALDEAWRWYGGPFLEEFATSGSAGFEQWCDRQRDRLADRWLQLAEQLTEQHAAAGRLRDAALIARRIREAHPQRTAHWTRELRSWLSLGDRQAALHTAQAFDETARSLAVRPDAALAAILAQLRAEPVTRAAGEQRLRLRPELVGRERALASLVRGWQTVQAGGAPVVAVTRGSAGIGKSRLLEELARRIGEGAGTRVVLRARPADRDMPYALAAALAEAVADLPGALGLSTASASALVDLAPALSSTFRTSTHRPVPAEDLLRTRTLALQELLGCVAEEAPIGVMIDDLHWADDASRQLLSSLADRLAGHPVLLVIATRLHGRPWAIPEGATIVDLTPLGLEQMAALLTSLGPCDAAVTAELAQILTDATGGVPMLALAALDLGLEQQVLRLDGDGWWCAGTDRFRRLVGPGGILERLLVDLPGSGVSMLAALALCGGPLEESVLLASSGDRTADEVLRTLATRGLVAQTPAGWELAHDRLADAVLATVHPAERRLVAQRCGQALLAEPSGTARGLQVAGRLLVAAGHPDQHLAFARWLRAGRNPGRWRDPTSSAATFLGDSVSPQEVRQLARQVPWMARLRYGFPGMVRAVAAILLLATSAAGGVSAEGWLEPAAARMLLVPPPSSNGFLFDWVDAAVPDAGDSGAPLRVIRVPIDVDFVDRRGMRTDRTPDSMTVHLVPVRGTPRLGGQISLPVVKGHVRFDDLTIIGSGAFQLEVRAGSLPPQRTQRLFAVMPDSLRTLERVELLSGEIAGQAIDSVQRRVTVAPNALLTGTLAIRTTTTVQQAAILLGAVPLWGDRRTNWIVLRALPPHGEAQFLQPLRDPVRGRVLRAPTRPGRYRLLLVLGAETEMRFIASGTNWMLESPTWFNGDDLADMTPQALDSIARFGYSRFQRLIRPTDGRPSPVMDPHVVVGTLLEVEVRP